MPTPFIERWLQKPVPRESAAKSLSGESAAKSLSGESAAETPKRGNTLEEIVSTGDLDGLRGWLDEQFWTASAARPGWPHLKIALQREDVPMMRLLCLWGAAPAEDDLRQLRAGTGESYPRCLALLRAAGLRPGETPWEDLRPAEPPVPHDEVARRAYEIYCAQGRRDGGDKENWLRAEAELIKTRRAAARRAYAAEAAARREPDTSARDAGPNAKKFVRAV